MSPILGIWASQISGHLWAPQGAYDALATVTLNTTTSSVTFTGIPTGYRHLQIRSIARFSGSGTGEGGYQLQFNGDTGASYTYHLLYGYGTGTGAQGYTTSTSGNAIWAATTPNNGNISNTFGVGIVDIIDYSSNAKNKTVRSLSGIDTNSNGASLVALASGMWVNTAPINNITIFASGNSFVANTQFALYGVK